MPVVKVGALIRISSLPAVASLTLFAFSTIIIGGTAKGDGSTTRPATSSAPQVAFVDARAVKLFAAQSTSARAAAPAVHLANISTRLVVGTGNNVLIAGFIITGNQPKRVVVRGLGPLLPVSENLSDPTLELHDSSGGTVGNDNWRDTQQEELILTTIAPINDYECAIVKSLNPGNYTAILAGKGGTTGIGLVEVYDLDLTVDSKLANISTRGFVDQGDNVLIGGTIILGNGTTDVLFRALGPSLSGIGNPLQDPTLELHDSQGNLIASNDNWQDTQRDAIVATTIPPPDTREAAILRQLTPGAYTAIVRGKGNATGVALIEAYQIN
jgi:hypothetical protein